MPKAKKEVVPTPVPQEFENTKETQSKAQEEVTKEIEKPQELKEKSNPKNYEETYINDNLQKIVQLIGEHVHYPKRAREMGISGEVRVQFTILKVGGIQNLEVLSGHALLKKSALKAIEEASLLFPKVEKDLAINVPIEYTLVQQR
jgi:protein TonB